MVRPYGTIGAPVPAGPKRVPLLIPPEERLFIPAQVVGLLEKVVDCP